MLKYTIQGGYPIKGRVKASGNKNAALPCIAAALLSDEKIVLKNIPEIEDVKVMFQVLQALGASVKSLGNHAYEVQTKDIKTHEIPVDLAKLVRASILFAGPMLARVGKVTLPPPGGDVIGRRRLDTHFLAFQELGARVEVDGAFKLSVNKLVGQDIFLDEASVTATENVVMAAVLADGTSVIQNAACEPHVQDLCKMLVKMGAKIDGLGSNVLRITGVKKLKGCEYSIDSDFMEVGSLIGLAAVTRGELEIEDACPQHLRMTKIAFGKMGIHWESDGSTIRVAPGQDLRVIPELDGGIPVIDDAPWPGFPTDLTSIVTVVATQIQGTILIHEKMYDSRMFFVDKLIGMGAKIILCDPHRAVITGPARLKGGPLVSPDVRAGMAMVIAAMCAEGESEIQNVYQIERGYENIAEKLLSIGARIERISDNC